MTTRQKREQQKIAYCICSILCEFRSYIDATSRPLAVWLRESRGSSRQIKINQRYGIGWDEGRSVETEGNCRYRKYKESAHMTSDMERMTNSVSQPSLGISPFWVLLINKEITNLQNSSAVTDPSVVSMRF
jgi:hypothetical protein